MRTNREKKSILVVDDEKQIVEMVQKVLSQAGYRVFTSTSGEEALKQLKQTAIDLILVDLKMPVMDGLEVLKHARGVRKNLKAVLLTAYGTAASAREALLLGVYDFLTKPFDNRLLRKVIREALSDKR